MKHLHISVVNDFSATPGGRYEKDGEWSGEEFRQRLARPLLLEAMATTGKLFINLDGTAGYATSFLEEAFGGLVRDVKKPISRFIEIQTDNSLRKREVEQYIVEAESKLK